MLAENPKVWFSLGDYGQDTLPKIPCLPIGCKVTLRQVTIRGAGVSLDLPVRSNPKIIDQIPREVPWN